MMWFSQTKSQSAYAISLVTALMVCAGRTEAVTRAAESARLADVQKAIARAADGDTVLVPSGTVTWNSTLSIKKNITLAGAGIGETVIVDGAGEQASPSAAKHRNAPLIDIKLARDVPLFRLTGFEFRGSPSARHGQRHVVIKAEGGSTAAQRPLVLGCTSGFRLDHCKFESLKGLPAIFSNIVGLVDHVEYIGKGDFCFVQHGSWNGADLGHGSWADKPYWGSRKFLFFEDCDFRNTGTSVPYGIDAYLGARFVVRHCRFHGNTGVTGHGTETPQRGTKQIEIYENSFEFPPGSRTRFPQLRSGSVLFHDNTFTDCIAGMSLRIYRQLSRYGPWGHSTGMNPWDENDEHPKPYAAGVVTSIKGRELTDSQSASGGAKKWSDHQFDGVDEGVSYIIKNMTSAPLPNGDPKQTFLVDNGPNTLTMGSVVIRFEVNDRYEIWKVKTSLDQPGQGEGALLAGNVKYGSVRFASSNAPGSWPQRGYPREPCYSWNNVNLSGGAGENAQLKLKSEQRSVKEGRDYINYGDVDTSPQEIGPVGSTYTYEPFIYPHPLQQP